VRGREPTARRRRLRLHLRSRRRRRRRPIASFAPTLVRALARLPRPAPCRGGVHVASGAQHGLSEVERRTEKETAQGLRIIRADAAPNPAPVLGHRRGSHLARARGPINKVARAGSE
jgi:hypothetical protein